MTTASADLNLLHLMGSSRDIYETYSRYVEKDYILIGETRTLLNAIGEYFTLYSTETKVDWSKFETWFRVVHKPLWKKEKHELISLLVGNLKALESLAPDEKVIEHFITLDHATKISEVCSQVAEGKQEAKENFVDLITRELDSYSARRSSLVSAKGSAPDADSVSYNIDELLEGSIRGQGLEWRLEDLNIALGPLHKGDLVFVCARPEVGKTSFVLSEFTYMGPQISGTMPLVVFNNEERGRLFLRCVSAGSGLSLLDVSKDSAAAGAKYDSLLGARDRIQFVEPAGGLSTYDIERVLKSKPYGLIAINVLDKVRLTHKASDTSDVERLRQLGIWARAIANQYAPVLVVLQADATAEGQRYLNQSQIYGSKTGLQGEADAIIMIGKDPSVEDKRYISIVKNKLPGGPRSVPAMRHGQFEVGFDETTGRYESLRYKKPL